MSECTCWWCGGKLVWQSDFTAGEFYGETGEEDWDNALVSVLTCSNCGAEIVYTESPVEEDQ